ncbi:hypothetical protein [Fibrella forsythiae]|uniref:Secreted protein n=1 Tax=Fibrella forsythiae TaxID=2817061 RepID=A0ABS3JLZ6_9BACT|nr:hypothetical protein [Fibrella forsythiae]MBO0951027.1 hypothetical protein [Fibrella forsythiae]
MAISILLVLLVLAGVSAYYASARFGCQSSGLTPLPPHYTHLTEPENKATEPVRQLETPAGQPVDQ